MKLSEAQDYQRRILDLTNQLNMAINEAVTNGMFVEVDVIEYQTLSTAGSTPKIQTNVFINPQDIDSL